MEPALIGLSEYSQQPVTIPAQDRHRHLAVCGKSGTGKTALLRSLIAQDLRSGLGLTVLDPHGSLIDEVLDLVPAWRTNDIVLLDPSQRERTLGINLLDAVPPEQRPLVVSSLIAIMKNTWPENWGPRSEYILEHAAYALLEQSQPVSLAALPKLLTDAAYREKVLRSVSDPAVRAFFVQYDQYQPHYREEIIAPLLNKVAKFITNPMLRAVIGQPTSSFDFTWLMNNSKVLLCRLSKGSLGSDISSLLGSVVVTKLALAALSRQDIPEDQRRLHLLVADEVQNFTYGIDLPTILAESRKYRLSLVVCTQSLAALPRPSVQAIFGNCASIISFRVAADDAEALTREFGTSGQGPQTADQMFSMILPASKLQELPDFTAYIRTLIQGQPSKPQLVTTLPPLNPKTSRRHRVINTSLQRFGRPRDEVERRINKFLAR